MSEIDLALLAWNSWRASEGEDPGIGYSGGPLRLIGTRGQLWIYCPAALASPEDGCEESWLWNGRDWTYDADCWPELESLYATGRPVR